MFLSLSLLLLLVFFFICLLFIFWRALKCSQVAVRKMRMTELGQLFVSLSPTLSSSLHFKGGEWSLSMVSSSCRRRRRCRFASVPGWHSNCPSSSGAFHSARFFGPHRQRRYCQQERSIRLNGRGNVALNTQQWEQTVSYMEQIHRSATVPLVSRSTTNGECFPV